jgi:AcrR family transcriptional regulator
MLVVKAVKAISSKGSKTLATAQAAKDIRERLIEAAARILRDEGYESLSMRHVAQEAGCSQMAMYRHFANKEALIQYLCVALYVRFTKEMDRKMAAISDPRERLLGFVEGLIHFARTHPDHYSLIFLVRHPDPETIEMREQLGQQFVAGIQETVRQALPPNAARAVVERCLRQILFCLHGGAALLIAHPKAYDLTEKRAADDTRAAIEALLDTAASVCAT